MRAPLLLSLAACFTFACTADDTTFGERRARLATQSEAVTALRSLAQRLVELGTSMGEQEDPLFQITQHLPVSEALEFDDDDDLAEFEEVVDVFVNALAQHIEAGALSQKAELRIPSDTFCALAAQPNETLFQTCVDKVDAIGLALTIGVESGAFVIETHFADVRPVVVRVTKDAVSVDVDLAVARSALDVVTTLLDLNIGQETIDDFFGLEGQLSVVAKLENQGLSLEVTMPKDIRAHIANSAFELLAKEGRNKTAPLISIRAGNEISASIHIGRIAATNLPLGLVQPERFGKDAVGDFVWEGLSYTGVAKDEETMPFTADVGDISFTSTTADDTLVLYARRALSGPLSGVAKGKERLGRFDLRKGFLTVYDQAARIETTHLGLTTEWRIPKGAELIDFRRSTVAKKKALIELVFKGQLTKINELVCLKEGTADLLVEGETLHADGDEDDNCLAGYFTKENDEPVYNVEVL